MSAPTTEPIDQTGLFPRRTSIPWPEQQQAVARVLDPVAFAAFAIRTEGRSGEWFARRRQRALDQATHLRDAGLLR